MKKYTFAILLFLIVSSTLTASGEQVNIIYKETIDSYSRIDGQTLRWQSEREFLLMDYSSFEINTSGSIIPYMNISMLDESTYGQTEHVIQELKPMNFIMTPVYVPETNYLAEIKWDILLFRNTNHSTVLVDRDPFTSEEAMLFSIKNHRRFDLQNIVNFFSVNLEHYEYIKNSTGHLEYIRVNTELFTNNEDDGRATRTSIHIIKRDSHQDIIFEYNWNIQQVNLIGSGLNYLDQPYLIVPFYMTLIFGSVYLYLRIHRFWTSNNIKIIREKIDNAEE